MLGMNASLDISGFLLPWHVTLPVSSMEAELCFGGDEVESVLERTACKFPFDVSERFCIATSRTERDQPSVVASGGSFKTSVCIDIYGLLPMDGVAMPAVWLPT
eukprot:2760931-Amphidinium_carterae.1